MKFSFLHPTRSHNFLTFCALACLDILRAFKRPNSLPFRGRNQIGQRAVAGQTSNTYEVDHKRVALAVTSGFERPSVSTFSETDLVDPTPTHSVALFVGFGSDLGIAGDGKDLVGGSELDWFFVTLGQDVILSRGQ